MTSKAEYTDQWSTHEPSERRERLNELGSNENKTDDEWREHDALAAMVAVDEDEALDAITKAEDANGNG